MYVADRFTEPVEVVPPAGRRKYWTRRGIAEWLVHELGSDQRTLAGIDHGFSFPLAYFQQHGVPLNWEHFLKDFQQHWPTDLPHVYVDFVREGIEGNAGARSGRSTWRRITETRSGRAKSVFHFDVPGSVAKSTHSGLPWLLYLRRHCSRTPHCWPFDGWEFPEGKSVLAEVYPSMFSRCFPAENRDEHQHDAYSIAAWLRQADGDGSLLRFAKPVLTHPDRRAASIEGWILGVE